MALDQIVEVLSAAGQKAKKAGQYAVLGLTLAFSPGYGGCDAEQYCDTAADCGDGQECLEGVCGGGEEGSCGNSPLVGKYLWHTWCDGGSREKLKEDCTGSLEGGPSGWDSIYFRYNALNLIITDGETSAYLQTITLHPSIEKSDFNTPEECYAFGGGIPSPERFNSLIEETLCAYSLWHEMNNTVEQYFFREFNGLICPDIINSFFKLTDQPWLGLTKCKEEMGEVQDKIFEQCQID